MKLFLLIFSALISSSFAQDAAQSGKLAPLPSLALGVLIEEAIKNNFQIKAATQDARSFQQNAKAKGSWEDPMVEFETMDYNAPNSMRTDQITVTQKIPFPGKLSRDQASAEYEAEAKNQELQRKKLEIIRSVKNAYFEFFLAHKKKELLLERQITLKQLTSSTRNKYAIGKATQAELLAFQVEEANILSLLLTVDKQIQSRAAELAALLGRDDAFEIQNGLPRLERSKVDESLLDEKTLIAKAQNTNPDIQQASAQYNAAERKHSLSNWNYLPDLTLKYRYTIRQKYQPEMPDSSSAGIGINIPLWFLFKQNPESRAAGAEMAKADANLSQQRVDFLRNIRFILADISDAKKRIDLFENGLLPLTKQAVTTSQSAFLSGKMEYVGVLSSVNARFQTEMDFNEALAQYEVKLAELDVLLGSPLGVKP